MFFGIEIIRTRNKCRRPHTKRSVTLHSLIHLTSDKCEASVQVYSCISVITVIVGRNLGISFLPNLVIYSCNVIRRYATNALKTKFPKRLPIMADLYLYHLWSSTLSYCTLLKLGILSGEVRKLIIFSCHMFITQQNLYAKHPLTFPLRIIGDFRPWQFYVILLARKRLHPRWCCDAWLLLQCQIPAELLMSASVKVSALILPLSRDEQVSGGLAGATWNPRPSLHRQMGHKIQFLPECHPI